MTKYQAQINKDAFTTALTVIGQATNEGGVTTIDDLISAITFMKANCELVLHPSNNK